jgi:hypothetical protein
VRCFPQIAWGDGLLYEVTPHTQLSRPITLRCFTSWRPDDGANVRVLRVPRQLGRDSRPLTSPARCMLLRKGCSTARGSSTLVEQQRDNNLSPVTSWPLTSQVYETFFLYVGNRCGKYSNDHFLRPHLRSNPRSDTNGEPIPSTQTLRVPPYPDSTQTTQTPRYYQPSHVTEN